MGPPTLVVPIRVAIKEHRCLTTLPSEQWLVCHRLVVPHPEFPQGGSLEIVWQRQGDRQQIAVYTGPDSPIRSLHLSLRLPTRQPDPLMAHLKKPVHSNNCGGSSSTSPLVLTHFDKDKYPILCCLLDPHTVVLFDIYPDKDASNPLPSEGWTIPLPFECKNIFPAYPGLLLQRQEDTIEIPTTPASSSSSPIDWKVHIPAPPFAKQTTTATDAPSLSLFSLHHHLEDVLPVETKHNFNPSETVIWVGLLQDEANLSRRYMVTHQTQVNVHVHFGSPIGYFKVYRVEATAPPPKQVPLHQQIRDRYDVTDRFDTNLLPDDALLFDQYWDDETNAQADTKLPPGNLTVHTGSADISSRDQALATALGVKTPHSPTELDASTLMLLPTSATLHAKLKTTLVQTVSIVNPSDEKLLHSATPQVFAVNDLLTIHAAGTIRLLHMTQAGNLVPIATILDNVVAAQPVNGGHGSNRRFLLLLRASRGGGAEQLELYRADQLVAYVSVKAGGGGGRPLGIRDAVGDRVTVDPLGRIAISLESGQEDVLAVIGFDKDLELALRVDMYIHKAAPGSWATLRSLFLRATLAVLQCQEIGGPFQKDEKHLLPPWELLLLSMTNRSDYVMDFRGESITEKLVRRHSGRDLMFSRLFDSLHLLAEEFKLSGNEKYGAVYVLLVQMLEIYCQAQGDTRTTTEFRSYYRSAISPEEYDRVVSHLSVRKSAGSQYRFSSFASPPSIFHWIQDTIAGTATLMYANTNSATIAKESYQLTRAAVRAYAILFDTRLGIDERRTKVVEVLFEEGFRFPQDVQERFSPGVALPLIETILHVRKTAISGNQWQAAHWDLVGRPDLARNTGEPLPLPKVIAQRDVCPENDGLRELETQASLLFPNDNRVREAASILRSSTPIAMRITRPVEASDHDYEQLKQKNLLILCSRAISLPVGRGMLTLGNNHDPPVTELLPIPQLCLKGRLSPTNVTVNLDMSECPPELMIWPNFHNGVATGLRLPSPGDGSEFRVTRSWIRFNKPPSSQEDEEVQATQMAKQDTHAGILLALGLRGQLDCLEMTDVYEYLIKGAITTTVGLLLGLAANNRGSCDIQASKMMSLHIPSLIPQHFSAIDVASAVQTAAVASLGLLYQGSGDRMMTEFLLNEIGRRPDSDVSTVDREAYSLSCGIALGTVNLGHGGLSHEKTAGLADLDIEERLIRYVAGGVDPDESRRTREASDRFSLRSTDNEGETERCSTVYEGKEINTNVCAPGAILALGLMFMKSGNVSVASRLKLPDTHFLLEFVRPDFLTLLVVAHSLIMWVDVVPTKEWIEEQIPSVVLEARIQMTARAKSSLLGKSSGTGLDLNFDCRAVRQMYVHALSGACFGVGIRFAGTGDCDAKSALMERVNELHALRISSDPAVAALRPEIPILETCLCCATISLVVVMAGTGDLDVFRLLRIVRWDRVQDIKYGVHMGYAMAVGLLFLGGGKCTLGREPEDIAALVTAFFPRFPSGTFDNQFHLQALRHLYVLATKPRVLQPINVKTGEHVSAKIQLKSASGRMQVLHAPCLLLNDEDTWETLEIVSPEFYPLKLEFPLKSNLLTFYVKKLKSESAADIVYMARRHNSLCVQNFKRLVIAKDSEVSFASRVHSETDRLAAEEILPIYLRLRFGGKLTQENLNVLRSYYLGRQRNGDEGDNLDCRLLLPYLQEIAIANTQQK